MFNSSKKLILWELNNTTRKWLTFCKKIKIKILISLMDSFILENIIFQIRKDMRKIERRIRKRRYLKFFINDVKKYFLMNLKSKLYIIYRR